MPVKNQQCKSRYSVVINRSPRMELKSFHKDLVMGMSILHPFEKRKEEKENVIVFWFFLGL